ncbi:hypothetical protein D3C72_2219340 [compost metagenome]
MEGGYPLHVIDAIACSAVDRLHANVVFLCRLDHVQKGKSVRGVGMVTRILTVEVALQIFREDAIPVENVQVCLMEVV